MGVFLGYLGKNEIDKDNLEDYVNKVKKILKYGGMVQFEQLKINRKELTLIRIPEVDDDGLICFHYNYFGDEAWETTCFNTNNGDFITNKVGSYEFLNVCSAIYVLSEYYNKSFGLAECNGELFDAKNIIGWLNYLFDENYTNVRAFDLWKIFELQHTYNMNDSISKILDNDNINPASLCTYLYLTKNDNNYWNNLISKNVEDNKFNIPNNIKKMENRILEIKDKTNYESLLSLLFKDKDSLKDIMLDDSNEFSSLGFFISTTPTVIILKLLCDSYNKDFWEEYEKNKDNFTYMGDYFWKDEDLVPKKIEAISTSKFLDIDDEDICFWGSKLDINYHKADDDFAYLWEDNGKLEFSNEFKVWCDDLKIFFDYINNEDYSLLNQREFFNDFVDTLNEANQTYKRIFAFEDMFYEFIENFNDKRYQSMVKLFKKVLEDNKEENLKIQEIKGNWDLVDRNITFNKGRLNVKRFLAIISNKSLRYKIFGF